jgi:hypothetical protein
MLDGSTDPAVAAVEDPVMIRRLMVHASQFVPLLLVLAAAALADIPPAPTSTLPAFIRMVGSTAGVPDTLAGKFVVTVRDIANNPVPNADVRVDLSSCLDIHMASDQLNPNYRVDCATRTVGVYTNVDGIAAFTLLGSSWAAGSYSGLSCARVYADGVLLGSPTVSAFDLTGSAGLTAADISVWLGDLGSMTYRGRSDFDQNGVLSAGDLSVWLGVLGKQHSSVTSVACP